MMICRQMSTCYEVLEMSPLAQNQTETKQTGHPDPSPTKALKQKTDDLFM